MANSVDNRVVRMEFDNGQFQEKVASTMESIKNLDNSLKLENGEKGFKNIQAAAQNMNLDRVAADVESLNSKFSVLGVAAASAISNITNRVVDMGLAMASSVTIDPIKQGFEEYKLQLNSVQTIMTNTKKFGTTIDDVNNTLGELNKYADQTVYNFGDMTRSIGQFTQAGLDLQTSTTAIKGMSNLAAGFGASTQDLSRGMYQMSQALAAGKIQLMDWRSMINANMAGESFQKALRMVSEEMQTGAEAAIAKQGSFNESLKEGWLTTEVMVETLNRMTVEGAMALDETKVSNKDFWVEQAKAFEDAATKIKTFDQLIDVIKEEMGSGWATSWTYIMGNFEEAKELFTSIGQPITAFISRMHDARNVVLQFWHDQQEGFAHSGREYIIAGLGHIVEAIQSIIAPVADAFDSVFSTVKYVKDEMGGTTAVLSDFGKNVATGMVEASRAFARFTKNLKMGEGYYKTVRTIFESIFKAVSLVGTAFEKVLSVGTFLASKGFEGLVTVLNVAFNVIAALSEPVINLAQQGFAILADAAQSVADSVSGFIDDLGPVGKFIESVGRALNQFAKDLNEGKPIAEAWEVLVHKLGVQWDQLGRALSSAGDIFGNFIDNILREFTPQTDELGNVTQNVYTRMSNNIKGFCDVATGAFDAVQQKIAPFIEFVKTAAGELNDFLSGTQHTNDLGQIEPNRFAKSSKAIGDFSDKIANGFNAAKDAVEGFASSISKEDIMKGISAVFAGLLAINFMKIAHGISNVVSSVGKVTKGVAEFGKGLAGIPDKIQDAIGAFENYYKDLGKAAKMQAAAEIIKSIALSIAALAGSLFLLSLIPEEKLYRSAMVLGVLFGAIAGMAMLLTKFNPVETIQQFAGLMGAASGLLSIGTAMIAFAIAVKLFSTVDVNDLAKSLIAIAAIMFIMVRSAKILSALEGDMAGVVKIASSIFILAMAMGAIATACLLFNFVQPEAMAKAGVALLALVGAAKLLSMISNSSGSFLKLAGSLMILGLALAEFGVIALAFTLIPTWGIIKAIVTLAIITKVATSLAKYSGMFARDIVSLAGVMAVLGAAMLELGVACLIFSAVSPEGMLKAGLALAAMLGAVLALSAIGENFAGGVEVMAAGLVSMALGMAIFAGIIVVLGSLPFGAVIAGVVGLGLAFAVLLAAAWGAEKVAFGLEALAMSLTAIGTGIALAGAGFLALSVGLVMLGTVGPAACEGIILAFTALAVGLVQIGTALGLAVVAAVVSLTNALANAAPQFLEAGHRLVDSWQQILDDGLIIEMGRVAGAMIIQFLAGLGEMVGALVAGGALLIVSILLGIAEHIGEIVNAGIQVAIQFIDGVATALDQNQGPLLDAIGHLFLSVAALLVEGLARIVEQFPGVGAQAAEAIRGWKDEWAPAAEESTAATVEASDPKGEIAGNLKDEMLNAKDELSDGGDLLEEAAGKISEYTGGAFDLSEMPKEAKAETSETAEVMSSVPYEDVISGKGQAAVKAFSSEFSKLGDGAKTACTNALKVIQSSDFSGPAKTQGGKALSGFKTGLNPAAWKTAGSNAAGQAKSGVESKNLYSAGYSIGQGLGDGLIAGMNSKIEAVRAKARELGNATDAVNDKPSVNSPSKFTLRIGEGLGEGLILGMHHMMTPVQRAGDTIGTTAAEAVSFAAQAADGVDWDAAPVIRPVLDTTSVDEGMARILGGSPKVDVGYVAGKLAVAQSARFAQAEQQAQAGRIYNFNLQYDAGADANQLVRDMTVAVRQSAML